MLWDMPHCIGAMDGKHVVVQTPSNTGSMDHNYKKSFSKLIFAVCDAKYRFVVMYVRRTCVIA